MPCFPLWREGERGAGVTFLLPCPGAGQEVRTHPWHQVSGPRQADPVRGTTLFKADHTVGLKQNKYQPLAHHFTQLRNRHQFIWQSLPHPSVPYMTTAMRVCWGGLLGLVPRFLLGLGCTQLLQLLCDEKSKIWRTFHSRF